MNSKTRGTLEMTAAMVISGTIGWFVVRSGQPVVDLLFWRCVFGAATLAIVCVAHRAAWRSLTPRRLGWAILGGAAIVLNWLLIFAAFSRASISIAIAVYNTQPFMLVAMGALFFSERLTVTKLLWLGVAFAGVLLIVQAQPAAGFEASFVSGILLALGAAFFFAVAAVLAKKLVGTPPHLIALVQVCVGVLMLAPFAHLSDLPSGARVWADFVVMGVVYTGLVFVLLYGAIQKLPTHSAGALSFLYPVVAIGVDYLAFDRRLHLLQFMGVAAILIAAAAMNRVSPLRKPNAAVTE